MIKRLQMIGKNSYLRGSLIWLYFIVLTIAMTWPLVRFMDTSVVGRIGDNVYFVWLFGWFRKAIFELHTSPFWVSSLNYPEGWSLAHTEMSLATIAIGFPFGLLKSYVFGYNFAALATFVLTGIFTYLWVFRLTGNRWAGLISGSFFAFTPYRMAHFRAGHLNLLGTMWLPLYFMAFMDLVQENKATRATPWLIGISLGLIGFSSIYYLYGTVLITALVILGMFLIRRRALTKDARFWRQGLLSITIALPLIILAVLPFLMLDTEGGLPSRDISQVVRGSASISDFILPATEHPVFGAWVSNSFSRNHWIEGTLYIGLIVLILSVIGVVTNWKIKSRRTVILGLLFISFSAFILALGTHLHWNEEMISIPIPETLQGWLTRDSIHLRLPVFYLFKYVPMFSRLRTFKRFAVFLLLALSCLAGIGVASLAKRIPRSVWPYFAILIFGLGMFEYYPGVYEDFSVVEARPVDSWLAEQSDQGAVAQFPFVQVEDQDQIYNTIIHGKPFIGGFFNAFPPEQYLRIRPVMAGFPDDESIRLLGQLGISYILVDKNGYDEIELLIDTCESLGAAYVTTIADQLVFKLNSADE